MGVLRNAGLIVNPDLSWRDGIVVVEENSEIRVVVTLEAEMKRISIRSETTKSVKIDDYSPSSLLDAVALPIKSFLDEKLPGLTAKLFFSH